MGVPGSLPPVPVRAVATAKVQDSGSESAEIICEGRVGVAVVSVGRTPDAGIRDADLSALRRPDGPGVVSVAGFLEADELRATRQAVSRIVPSAAQPIFNTQSVAEMRRAMLDGAPVDRQRRQAFMNRRWASTAIVNLFCFLYCFTVWLPFCRQARPFVPKC